MSMSGRIEAQLKAEVEPICSARAEAADAADVPDGMSIPDELARREERLRKLAEAKATIEARAKERHAREMAEHEAKMAAREAKIAATASGRASRRRRRPKGRCRRSGQSDGRGVRASCRRRAGGFDRAPQRAEPRSPREASVVAVDVVEAPNDKNQVSNRCRRRSARRPKAWARSTDVPPADTGDFSAGAAAGGEKAGVEPVIADGPPAPIDPPPRRSASQAARGRAGTT